MKYDFTVSSVQVINGSMKGTPFELKEYLFSDTPPTKSSCLLLSPFYRFIFEENVTRMNC